MCIVNGNTSNILLKGHTYINNTVYTVYIKNKVQHTLEAPDLCFNKFKGIYTWPVMFCGVKFVIHKIV